MRWFERHAGVIIAALITGIATVTAALIGFVAARQNLKSENEVLQRELASLREQVKQQPSERGAELPGSSTTSESASHGSMVEALRSSPPSKSVQPIIPPCSEARITIPDPAPSNEFPAGIIGTRITVQASGCWTAWLTPRQQLQPWAMDVTAPVEYSIQGGTYDYGGKVDPPSGRHIFNTPWRAIRFSNPNDAPVSVTLLFYGTGS